MQLQKSAESVQLSPGSQKCEINLIIEFYNLFYNQYNTVN